MNNPLLKNNKTFLLEDLQNRTSHYNRILCAKSLYTPQMPRRNSLYSIINCKFKNNFEAQRKMVNKKLVKSLIQIEEKGSRYCKQQYREPHSLKNYFCIKQENNKIMGENFQLFKKIVNSNSTIGSKKKWKSRKRKLQQYTKLLDNKRDSYLSLDQQFFSAFNKLRKKSSRRSPQSLLRVQSKFSESQRLTPQKLKITKERSHTQPILEEKQQNQQK